MLCDRRANYMAGIKQCPNPKFCEMQFSVDEGFESVDCPKCKFSFCPKCFEKPHKGISCAEEKKRKEFISKSAK